MMIKNHSTVSALTPVNIINCPHEREELLIAGKKGWIGKETTVIIRYLNVSSVKHILPCSLKQEHWFWNIIFLPSATLVFTFLLMYYEQKQQESQMT